MSDLDLGHPPQELETVTPNGAIIRQLRIAKNLSQEALVAQTTISLRTLRRAESGKPISRQSLSYIARALAVDTIRIISHSSYEDDLIFSKKASDQEIAWMAEILSFSYLHFLTPSWLDVTLKVLNDLIHREIPPLGINTKHMAMIFFSKNRSRTDEYFYQNKAEMTDAVQAIFQNIIADDSRWSEDDIP